MIIIGLLVAGITGGASLIESAKIRAFVNEMNSYKQAVATFKVAKGRLPGDLNNDGCIGYLGNIPGCVEETYKVGDFKEPFDEIKIEQFQSPFVELYLEKLIDYDENNNNLLQPYSKIFKDEKNGLGIYSFETLSNNAGVYMSNIKESGEIFLRYFYHPFDPEIAKKIDLVVDDGFYNSGNIRAKCSLLDGSWDDISYDQTIDDPEGRCNLLFYKINL